MPVTRVPMYDSPDFEAAVARAADQMRRGALAAFPTETAYAVGASAAHPDAARRLRELKSSEDSLYCLQVLGADSARPYIGEPGRVASRFMARAWPGPLTVLCEAKGDPEGAARMSPAGRELVYRNNRLAVRCPDHDVALSLIHFLGEPLVAVGAGEPGRPAPREPEQVLELYGDRIDLLLDDGPCRYSKGTTIVRADGDQWEIVRVGMLEERVLKQLASKLIIFVCTGNSCRSPMAEGLFRRMLAEEQGIPEEGLAERGLSVMSAGVYASPGRPASPDAVIAAGELGADISRHRSRPLTPELLHAADRVFTMTREHRDAACRLAPGCCGKVVPLDPRGDVDDPVGMELDTYRRCAARIRELLVPLLKEIGP